jgi:hypothetical protein
MYDIIRYDCEDAKAREQGFARLFGISACKGAIIECASVADSLKFSNRRSMVLLSDLKPDIGTMRKFSEGNSAYLLTLGQIISRSGQARALEIRRVRRFARLCAKFGVPFCIATLCDSAGSQRTAHEIRSICHAISLNPGQAEIASERIFSFLGAKPKTG